MALLILLCMSDGAWAGFNPGVQKCNGTNKGMPCFTTQWLPGTCADGSATCNPEPDPDGTCTFLPVYDPKTANPPGSGLISTIINDVQNQLDPLAADMFNGISSDTGIIGIMSAALTLYVIIYALMFMMGMVQLTAYDFMIRMVKITVVATLINGAAWPQFSATFIRFFGLGKDGASGAANGALDIINNVSGNPLGGAPFDWMDNTIYEVTSVKMMVTLMAAAMTGPYGIVVIVLLALSLYVFMKGMLHALWVYLMAYVLQIILFGLAPLFLACVLFTRTRQLFDGWCNQVVNTCLQPIFLFTFFSFFIQLVKSCLDYMLMVPVCWTEWGETLRGAQFAEHYWRFAIWDCNLGIWVPFDGLWSFNGPDNTNMNCPVASSHPLGMLMPLTLWILCDLAKRFNSIVVTIAKDISGASTNFGSLGKAFGEIGQAVSSQPASSKPPARAPERKGPPALKPPDRPGLTDTPEGKRKSEILKKKIEVLSRQRKNPTDRTGHTIKAPEK